MSKKSKVSKSIKKVNKKREPVWKGPEDSGPQGGITQSLLNRFVVDRERFRVHVIEGLQAQPQFNHRLDFGNLWHTCEEAYAAGEDWRTKLDLETEKLFKKYPTDRAAVLKWWNVIKHQFPVYVKYWAQKDKQKGKNKDLTNLLQEQVFHVPYTLPSGRVVWLKGKWDRVDIYHIHPITFKKEDGIWLGEHKTKGEIDELDIRRRLRFDIQTMLYLVALKEAGQQRGNFDPDDPTRSLLVPYPGANLMGVNYNVIRRPFSGGKGSIKKHKPNKKNPRGESDAEFYARLRDNYIAKEPEKWFARWNIEVTPSDIEEYKRKFLNPCLEQLCDWYVWVTSGDVWSPNSKIVVDTKGPAPDRRIIDYSIHYQIPYGIYNPVLEGARTDLDDYLESGSELGLVHVEELFSELK